MKKHAAEYRFLIRKVKKICGLDEQQICEKIIREDFSFLPQHISLNDLRIAGFCMLAEYSYLKGGAGSYFIETQRLSSHFEKLPLDLSYNPIFVQKLVTPFPTFQRGAGIIHTTGKTAKAILYAINIHSNLTHIFTRTNNRKGCFVCEPGKSIDCSVFGEYSADAKEAINLILGMGLWIHTYPHALVAGFPEWAKHQNHYKNSVCYDLRLVKEGIKQDGTPKLLIPHNRDAHERTLTHPRFFGEDYEPGKSKRVVQVGPKNGIIKVKGGAIIVKENP